MNFLLFLLAWTKNKLKIKTSKRADKHEEEGEKELIIEKENEMKIERER
jgi:hypothetical protein